VPNDLTVPVVESAVLDGDLLTIILDFPCDMDTGIDVGLGDFTIALDVPGDYPLDTAAWLSNRRLSLLYTGVPALATEADLVYVNSVGFLRDLFGQQYAGFNIDDIPIT